MSVTRSYTYICICMYICIDERVADSTVIIDKLAITCKSKRMHIHVFIYTRIYESLMRVHVCVFVSRVSKCNVYMYVNYLNFNYIILKKIRQWASVSLATYGQGLAICARSSYCLRHSVATGAGRRAR